MLNNRISIGKVFGIPLYLHYSWFIVFALVTFSLGAGYFPEEYPQWGSPESFLAAALTSLLFFTSLMMHELMHSVVAQRAGIPIDSITLFILGGVSQMSKEPEKAGDEFRIAVAGPLTSLILGAAFWGIWLAFRNSSDFVDGVCFWVGWINIAVAIFNMIPGFPLDGGRVMRSTLWWRRGNFRTATHTASTIGRGVGYLFMFGGLMMIFWGLLFNGLWLIFIGWFLENAASASYQQVALEDILKGHTVSEIMTRDCAIVTPDITLEHLAQEHILKSGRRCFPVIEGDKAIGLVSIHHIKSLPQGQWNRKTVREAMTPLGKLHVVHPDDEIASVMQFLTEGDVNQLPVLDNDGHIVGMVARDNLLAYIKTRSDLGI